MKVNTGPPATFPALQNYYCRMYGKCKLLISAVEATTWQQVSGILGWRGNAVRNASQLESHTANNAHEMDGRSCANVAYCSIRNKRDVSEGW